MWVYYGGMNTTCEYAKNANKRLARIIGTLESTPVNDTYIKCYLTCADLLTLKEIQQYIDILIVENNKLQRLSENLLFIQRNT